MYGFAPFGFGPLGGPFTTALEDPVDPVPVEPFIPSISRTIRILPGKTVYDAGAFWTVQGTSGPVGNKDPQSTIDIYFDWTAWLADIGGAKLSNIAFILGGGIESAGIVPTETGGTIFVTGGTLNADCTVTCRITTATDPARVDDRTAILKIRDQ